MRGQIHIDEMHQEGNTAVSRANANPRRVVVGVNGPYFTSRRRRPQLLKSVIQNSNPAIKSTSGNQASRGAIATPQTGRWEILPTLDLISPDSQFNNITDPSRMPTIAESPSGENLARYPRSSFFISCTNTRFMSRGLTLEP
jgi:hypothetical protein